MTIASQIITGKLFRPFKILLYGANGIGKSTFASQMPSPLILDIEGNTDHLTVPRIAIRSHASLGEVWDFLKGDHAYRTLVVDSLDMLEKLIWEQICLENSVRSIEDIRYGKGYVKALGLWKSFLDEMDALRDRGMSIVFLGHPANVKTQNLQGEEYEYKTLRINQRVTDLISDWCHCILYATFEVYVQSQSGRSKKGVGGERKLYTMGYGEFLAKNIYGLPDELAFSWPELATHIKAFFKSTETTTE